MISWLHLTALLLLTPCAAEPWHGGWKGEWKAHGLLPLRQLEDGSALSHPSGVSSPAENESYPHLMDGGFGSWKDCCSQTEPIACSVSLGDYILRFEPGMISMEKAVSPHS